MSACVCGETSCRNCPEHSEPEPEELREATLFRMRRASRHLCSQAVIDPGDAEYTCPPQWVRD